MEGANDDLLNKLKQEKDWNLSCIFNDKHRVIVDNSCKLLEDEIK